MVTNNRPLPPIADLFCRIPIFQLTSVARPSGMGLSRVGVPTPDEILGVVPQSLTVRSESRVAKGCGDYLSVPFAAMASINWREKQMNRAESSRRNTMPRRALLGGLLLSACCLASTATVRAEIGPNGVVYIESNTPDNHILGFRLNDAGKLVPLPGSPYSMGGAGTNPDSLTAAGLGPFDSDQNMVRHGDRIFAVNSGSDTVAVFDIRRNGSLSPVHGSPFPSGGVNPVSVGVSGNTLVVVNKDYDLGRPGFMNALRRPNYTTFRITPRGQLNPIPNGTIVADDTGGMGFGHANPTQALVTTNGHVVIDANFIGLMIRSFTLGHNGRLIPADAQMLPPSESPTAGNPFQMPVPLGLQVHPKANVFYVGLVLDRKFAVYNYDPKNGHFSFVRAVTGTENALVGPCWFVINRAGTRMYAANNFNNSISVYSVDDPRNPIALQTIPLSQGLKMGAPFQMAIDASGHHLFVVTQTAGNGQPNGNSLQALTIESNGLLTLLDNVILPTAPSRPQGAVSR